MPCFTSGGRVVTDCEDCQVQLSADTDAQDTTFELNWVPEGLAVGELIAVDAFTSQCELAQVVSVSDTTVTVSRLMFAHAEGDLVVVLPDRVVPASFYALTNTTTDQWQQLQRLTLEARFWTATVSLTPTVTQVTQPILVDSNSRWDRVTIRSHSTFAPVDADNAMVMIGNGSWFFTADAATNTFTSTLNDYTTPTSHGVSAGALLSFNAPYGETLPGDLVPGRVYYVKTAPTASTFTISETLGGATFDITSDGTGWSVNDVTNGLARIHWETAHLVVTVADLDGLKASLQQPSWTRNLRVDMQATASAPDGAIGFLLTGQLSYHDNIEINTMGGNTVGMWVEGSGHIVRGFNDNGNATGTDVALVFNEAQNCAVRDPWTENNSVGIRIQGTSRAIEIGGTWLGALTALSDPMLLVTTTTTSYRVAQIRVAASSQLIISDTARGIALYSDGGPDVVTDDAHTFAGLYQPYGAVAPTLTQRRYTVTSTSATIQHGQEFLEVNATSAAKTMTLPLTTGWLGWAVSVCNGSTAGVNPVTVDCTGGETIEGDPSIDLVLGETVTFLAVQSAYRRIGGFTP